MKRLFLLLAFMLSAPAFAAPSPASQFVYDGLMEGKQILESRDGSNRHERMCALLSDRFDTQGISEVWLGEYRQLPREAKAVADFPRLVPAVLIAKVFGDLSGAGGKLKGTFVVDDQAVDRGNGRLAVPVTVTSEAGRTFQGTVILVTRQKGFRVADIEYMNMSAVDYQGQEYQDILLEEYNKDHSASMPVSVLIQRIESDSAFTPCL